MSLFRANSLYVSIHIIHIQLRRNNETHTHKHDAMNKCRKCTTSLFKRELQTQQQH